LKYLDHRRFIPTCVGNMLNLRIEEFHLSVHPHVCGEHVEGGRECQRITVHPHVCGEHVIAEDAAAGMDGSSPRVWGT